MKYLRFTLLASIAFALTCNSFAFGSESLDDLAIGQSFTFKLRWNGIPVGEVSTTTEELTEVRGRMAYKVVLSARTNKWASLIYRVDDKFVSYIDYETSNSLRHEVFRSEGRYRKKTIIDYIYGRFLAEYHYLKGGKRKTVKVLPNVHDPLSASYYFLRRKIKIGDEIILNIDLNEKKYTLFTRIEKGRPIRISKLGKFDTLIVRPYLERKGKPYKRGKGLAFISRSPKKLPLFIVVNVLIWGRFSATLLPAS